MTEAKELAQEPEKRAPWVFHRDVPVLDVWEDGKKHTMRWHAEDRVLVYEQNVQIGHKMTTWGTPEQSSVYDLARIDTGKPLNHQMQAMWECGRDVGHREGYAAAMADLRKLIRWEKP